jgi:hypothetical protein
MGLWIRIVATAFISACAAFAPVAPALAQGAVGGDAPPLIAGRVAVVEGDVLIWRAEEAGGGQWDRAQINDIVTVGTGLATDNGRAEVRVGPNVLRLGQSSTGGFSQLDYGAKVFNLERGTVNLRLSSPQQGETVALTVTDVRVDFSVPGRYRIDAIDNQPLAVNVFDGQATVRYNGNAIAVGPGEVLSMTQSSSNISTARMSALDEWALARDLRYEQQPVPQYVSTSMTGYEDLAAYGDWSNDAIYGAVWYPRAVPVGWAPYRYGQWRWVAPWGWSWVDAAPWGYAPFHYGRWLTVGGRWCWWPGAYVARPVWGPAMVTFVGGSTVVSAYGGPGVGWYPLAPWHPYKPYYRANNTYVTVINKTVIQQPPQGVPYDANQRRGSTWVEAPRFREPIAKVRIPARTEKVADATPMPPPPRPIARTAPVGGDGRSGGERIAPARPAPQVATNSKFAVAPQQPLPGANTTLTQPAPIRRVEARPQPAPAQLPEREAPRAQPRVPQEIVPPYQQLQKPFPAEPARTPPAAPPTVPQPQPVVQPKVAGAPPPYVTPRAPQAQPRVPSATRAVSPAQADARVMPPQAHSRVPSATPTPPPAQADARVMPPQAHSRVPPQPPVQGIAPATMGPPSPQPHSRVPPPQPTQAIAPVPTIAPPPAVIASPRAPQAQPPQQAQPGRAPQAQSKEDGGSRGEGRGGKTSVDVPRAKTVAQ